MRQVDVSATLTRADRVDFAIHGTGNTALSAFLDHCIETSRSLFAFSQSKAVRAEVTCVDMLPFVFSLEFDSSSEQSLLSLSS